MFRKGFTYPSRKSIFYKYLSILFMTLIIPVVILGITAYVYFNHSIEKEINKKHETMVEQTAKRVDNLFNDLKRSVLTLSMDEEVNNSFYEGNISKITMINISRRLRNFNILDDSVESTAIYYPNNGFMITSDGLYGFDSYFSFHSYENKKSQDWTKLFKELTGFKLLNETKVNYTSSDGSVNNSLKLIPAIFALPFEKTPRAYMLVNLKQDYFYQVFNSNIDNKGRFIGIFNPDGSLFLSTDTLSSTEQNRADIFKAITTNKNTFKIDSTQYYILFSPLSFNNGYLVWIIPAGKYNNVSRNILITMSLIVTVLLFAGVPLIIYASNRFYRPIKSILNISGDDGQKKPVGSELDYISKYIQHLSAYSGFLKNELEKNHPLIKEKLFRDLLINRGNFTDYTKLLRIIPEYTPLYSLVLETDFKFQYSESFPETISSTFFSQCSELLCSDVYGMDRGIYTCVLGTTSDIDSLISRLSSIVDKATFPECRLIVALGDPVDKPELLHMSYDCACNLLNYKVLEDRNQLISSKNTKKRMTLRSINSNNTLANYLLANDLENSIQHMNDIFNEFYNYKQPLYRLKSFFSQYISVINHVLSEKKIDPLEVYSSEEELLRKLDKCYDMEEVKEIFIEISQKVVDVSKKNKRSNNTELINWIIDYINQNYNNEIFLDLVAEKVGISSKYLSRFFKEQTGVNFVDYVNRLRVNKAKEHLKNIDIKITEIPTLVGVNNMSTFDRIFKKYEGISPAVYREILSQKVENR